MSDAGSSNSVIGSPEQLRAVLKLTELAMVFWYGLAPIPLFLELYRRATGLACVVYRNRHAVQVELRGALKIDKKTDAFWQRAVLSE
jgi:hypothetical protein